MESPLKILKKQTKNKPKVNRTNIKLKKKYKTDLCGRFFFFFGSAAQLLGSYWAHTRDQIWVLGSKHRVLTTDCQGIPWTFILLCPINQVHVNAIHMGKLLPELSETTRLSRINAVFTFSWTRSLLRMCTAPGRVEEGAGDGQEAHGVAKLG